MTESENSGSGRELTPERLNQLLRPSHPDVDVESVRVLDTTEGSASRVRIEVEYVEGRDAGLPPRIFVKRNLARFNFPPEMYSTEVRIYRDVLPNLDIEKPEVYAIEATGDDIEFTILMEDLSRRPGGRLGIVTDPNTVEEVGAVLDTVADFHAPWWGGDRLDRELPWLMPPSLNAQMQFWRNFGPRLAGRHMERGHRAPLVDRAVWTDDALWGGYDRLLQIMDTKPHTLVHADVHSGNLYYVDTGQEPLGGVLDWQMAIRGCWAVDVAYLLTTALDEDQLAENEGILIERYRDRIASAGVEPPSIADLWFLYRCHALYGVLMWLITPDGVHTDEAQIGYLTRCLAAANRLGTLVELGVG